jgi:uncharacterized protein YndB with AHSA1/START domain
MGTETIDWTTFKKRIFIQKPLNDIYKSWSTKSQIEQWFLEKANYYDKSGKARKPNEPVQKGGRFVWKWNNWNFEEEGQILNANGSDKLSFTFGAGGDVHIQLNERNGATEVILTQDNIPTDDKSKKEFFVGCSTGWTFWLANLKAWLEHGITLHVKGLSQDETTDLVNS